MIAHIKAIATCCRFWMTASLLIRVSMSDSVSVLDSVLELDSDSVLDSVSVLVSVLESNSLVSPEYPDSLPDPSDSSFKLVMCFARIPLLFIQKHVSNLKTKHSGSPALPSSQPLPSSCTGCIENRRSVDHQYRSSSKCIECTHCHCTDLSLQFCSSR